MASAIVAVGWLFDVNVECNIVTLWIKTTEGSTIRLTGEYQPSLYVLPTSEQTGQDLFHTLSQQPKITVEWQDKCTNIFERGDGMKRLLCIHTECVYYYKALVKRLEKDPRVAQLFNADLTHIQQYLFTRLKVEPTCKVQVEYDNTDLQNLTKIYEHEDIHPPPFAAMYFEVIRSASLYSLDSYDVNVPIRQITARYQEEPELVFAGDEEETILRNFCKYVADNDPDILISTEQHYRSTSVLKYVFARIEKHGLDVGLGRTNKRNSIEGRVYLDSNSFDSVVGLIEKARFACLTLSLAARCRISRLIDSRNCYELIQRGYVISPDDRLEPIRTIEEILAYDKGGMILSPLLGLHENVAVLDYENEYANLILQHNLSYEHTSNDIKGYPTVIESVIDRRVMFKNLQKSFPVNTREWLSCEQRIDALKSILVSLYGTTGSFWNRLANVETFEEINRMSRDVLMRTKDIVQGLGYTILYADTDSIFLQKDGATFEDFNSVKDVLAKDIGLPISLECYYKYLVLLPLEADEKIEALKHYYGITHNNELVARGIEIRRHDAPHFIKDFQTELLYTLFDCNDTTEVLLKGYENALLVATRTIDKVMTGELHVKDLVVSKILRQDLRKYKNLFPHVAAALQLSEAGIPLVRGDTINYVYTDASHSNPLCLVKPVNLIEEDYEQDYDKEKYRDMLLDAAETVLACFGFSRTLYGDSSRRNRKWWHTLREERMKNRETERSLV